MKTKVNIVDKDDNIIGAKYKEDALKNGDIRQVARIFLIRDKKIYLQKRAPNKLQFPNCWDQSAGGHIDQGETYIQGAKRELAEELGITNVELIELGKFYYEGEFHENIPARQFGKVYYAIFANQEISLQKSEISEGKWVDISAVNQMILDNPQAFAPGFIKAWEWYGDKIPQ